MLSLVIQNDTDLHVDLNSKNNNNMFSNSVTQIISCNHDFIFTTILANMTNASRLLPYWQQAQTIRVIAQLISAQPQLISLSSLSSFRKDSTSTFSRV